MSFGLIPLIFSFDWQASTIVFARRWCVDTRHRVQRGALHSRPARRGSSVLPLTLATCTAAVAYTGTLLILSVCV